MWRHLTLIPICALLLVAGCTWGEPGPTFTPWPTLTPTIASVTVAEPAPPATHTPTPDTQDKDTNFMETQYPDMPSAASERNQMFSSPPPMVIDPARSYRATVRTAKGDIVCDLDAASAPQTVNNFVYLARSGFYAGLTFHRVVAGFVIQGGDPLARGNGGPGYTLPAEIGLPHTRGAVAMARLGDQVNPRRDSSGSQFYITLDSTPHLDGAYTVFGQVIEGQDVVESIAVGDVIVDIAIEEQ